MNANSLAAETDDGRIAERSNVFVIATLYCAAGSAPVRVRNLSPSGALIEGSVLPLPGSRVRMCRGRLQASGEVVWNGDGRAGVRFGCSISVAEWLPGAGPASGQQHIDEAVFEAKRGASRECDAGVRESSATSSGVALELGALASGLTRLCEELADDAHVAAHFPENLQLIEATARRLDRLAGAALLALGKS